MSRISIASPAAGAATYTISAPAGSTDRTVVLPDSNGTILTTATAGVPVNGPAFSAYQSAAQAFSSSTWTKVQFQTKEFDTNSNFDNTTNYRFQPTVAGYYQVSGAFTNATFLAQIGLNVYKNGAPYKRVYGGTGGSATSTGAGSCLVYLNGSTDYVELYASTSSAQNAYAFADSTYFQAAMIRSAT